MTEVSPLEQQQLDLADPSAHTFWHWVRFDLVTDVADQHRSSQIVDLGAGSGMFGDRLATTRSDLSYRFNESSPALDAMLGDRFGADARLAPTDRIGRSATAAALDVIEHIEHDVDALSAWREQMDSGVRLVVTVPAGQWAFSDFDTQLGHFRRYSKRSLRRSLESAGFEVERCDYLFPELLPLVVARRLRPSSNTVDVPALSPIKNKIGYALSSLTCRLRRIWPHGTSVYAVCHNP